MGGLSEGVPASQVLGAGGAVRQVLLALGEDRAWPEGQVAS